MAPRAPSGTGHHRQRPCGGVIEGESFQPVRMAEAEGEHKRLREFKAHGKTKTGFERRREEALKRQREAKVDRQRQAREMADQVRAVRVYATSQ